jgi:hypothetical protein
MVNEMRIETGIDLDALIVYARCVQEVLGWRWGHTTGGGARRVGS